MRAAPLPQRLPIAVLNLCWSLAALYFRTGASGATYDGLRRMLGTESQATLYRTVRAGVEHDVVKVVMADMPQGAPGSRPLVLLKRSTLKQLEAVWLAKR